MSSEPKIVLWDLEIIPNLRSALENWIDLSPYHTGGRTMKAEVTSICCAGIKVLGKRKTKVIHAWDFPEWKENVNDDKKLCEAIYKEIADADCLIHQNGDRFDLPYFQTRLLLNGLPTLPPIPTVDVKKVSRSKLFLLSNSLKHLAKTLTDDRKMDHGEGWQLWIDTHDRRKRAMNLMSRYCKQDVVSMEKVFMALRPFINKLPNQNLWRNKREDLECCPSCGSEHIVYEGYRHTKTRSYRRISCKTCKAWGQLDAKEENPRSL